MRITRDFYTLVTKDGDTQQIDEKTAMSVAGAIEDKILDTIWFDDLAGSKTFVRLEDISTIYHTSPEIRQNIREHNKAMRAEDPSWEG